MTNGAMDDDPRWPRLLSLAVHEFRTPITVVAGYISMLLKDRAGPLTDQQRRLLQEAEKSAARLSALTSEMSEVSKLEAGSIKLTRTRSEIGPLITESIAALGPLPDRQVDVTLRDNAPGAALLADPARLKTAMTSVLVALRRELVTSKELVVHLRREPEMEQRLLRISVAGDERIEDLERAPVDQLVRFYEMRGGCGLSLVIARRVFAAHDGRIWSPKADPTESLTEDNVHEASKAGVVITLPEAQ